MFILSISITSTITIFSPVVSTGIFLLPGYLSLLLVRRPILGSVQDSLWNLRYPGRAFIQIADAAI